MTTYLVGEVYFLDQNERWNDHTGPCAVFLGEPYRLQFSSESIVDDYCADRGLGYLDPAKYQHPWVVIK